MNPFLNPFFTTKIIRHYAKDVNRAWKKTPEEIIRYQDKALRKTIHYAYQVPLYHRKYREAGIHPHDIRGMRDLTKLPLITKNDLIQGFPQDIIPPGYKQKEAYLVGTSGSSGRPMQMYKDIEYIMIEALAGVRQLRAYGLNWRKTRVTNIGDFSIPKTTDQECLEKGLMGNLSTFFSLKNYQHLYTGEEARFLLDKMSDFHPELVIGYTSVLMGIATLIRQGKGTRVSPRYVIGSGEVLDDYSRRYIGDGLDAPVLNLYATTEGGSIAFECLRNHFHVNSDFVQVEILDGNGNPVSGNDFGSIVITRLYPGGTPIVRYTGLHDLGSLEDGYCDCGMHTPLLRNLEGRRKDAVIFPDGRIFPPATLPMPLSLAMDRFNTLQVKRFQFIQKKIDDLKINVEIDENERDVGVPVEKLLKEIQNNYEKLAGDAVQVSVKEVKQVEQPSGSLSPPLIISQVTREKIEKALL
jgi:phenylacetate-CoA ligase